MKHSTLITCFMFILFLTTQLLGLIIINEYVDIDATAETGVTTLNEEIYATANFAPPEVENESLTFLYIMIAVLVGTSIFLLIVKFKKRNMWKIWFFLSVVFCLILGLTPFIYKLFKALFTSMSLEVLQSTAYYTTLVLAIILAFYKIFKHNIYVHNFTELFIYGGLAALIVPILNLFSVIFLLILISLYDAYAVWKSKHMVSMAKFQSKEKIFAGLLLPYTVKGNKTEIFPSKSIHKEIKHTKTKSSAKTIQAQAEKGVSGVKGVKTALLGGGDMAFPLLFAGVVLKTTTSFVAAGIISFSAAIALFALLYFGKKDRFYPAMPFISAGCFVGYALTLLL